jgi:hypothetical protein
MDLWCVCDVYIAYKVVLTTTSIYIIMIITLILFSSLFHLSPTPNLCSLHILHPPPLLFHSPPLLLSTIAPFSALCSALDNNFVHLVNNSITKDHKEFHEKVRKSVNGHCTDF